MHYHLSNPQTVLLNSSYNSSVLFNIRESIISISISQHNTFSQVVLSFLLPDASLMYQIVEVELLSNKHLYIRFLKLFHFFCFFQRPTYYFSHDTKFTKTDFINFDIFQSIHYLVPQYIFWTCITNMPIPSAP